MGAFGGWFVDVLVRYLVDCLVLYTRVFSGVGSLYLWKGILGGGGGQLLDVFIYILLLHSHRSYTQTHTTIM